MMTLFLCTRPRMNDEHQHDANDDRDEGCPQVVGDRQDSQSTASLRVHGRQARHKTGGKNRKCVISVDEHLSGLWNFLNIE